MNSLEICNKRSVSVCIKKATINNTLHNNSSAYLVFHAHTLCA